MKIIVGFSKSRTFKPFSWAIQAIERTPFSHVYLRFHSDKFDRELIYQASGLAVNFCGEKIFLEHSKIVDEFEIEITDETFVDLIKYAIDQAGKPYGLKSVFALGLWLTLKIRTKIADGEKTFFCSELIARMLLRDNLIKKPIGTDIEEITPKVLHQILTEQFPKQ